eukprot:11191377-Lingulodinium_polyedra.AAC.1
MSAGSGGVSGGRVCASGSSAAASWLVCTRLSLLAESRNFRCSGCATAGRGVPRRRAPSDAV